MRRSDSRPRTGIVSIQLLMVFANANKPWEDGTSDFGGRAGRAMGELRARDARIPSVTDLALPRKAKIGLISGSPHPTGDAMNDILVGEAALLDPFPPLLQESLAVHAKEELGTIRRVLVAQGDRALYDVSTPTPAEIAGDIDIEVPKCGLGSGTGTFRVPRDRDQAPRMIWAKENIKGIVCGILADELLDQTVPHTPEPSHAGHTFFGGILALGPVVLIHVEFQVNHRPETAGMLTGDIGAMGTAKQFLLTKPAEERNDH
ncbi:hypothetical protein CBS147339_10005 [Penicillium roqueforti]|nr:hypothetical protein CBS147339_10005 [Penicillium roqueforti]